MMVQWTWWIFHQRAVLSSWTTDMDAWRPFQTRPQSRTTPSLSVSFNSPIWAIIVAYRDMAVVRWCWSKSKVSRVLVSKYSQTRGAACAQACSRFLFKVINLKVQTASEYATVSCKAHLCTRTTSDAGTSSDDMWLLIYICAGVAILFLLGLSGYFFFMERKRESLPFLSLSVCEVNKSERVLVDPLGKEWTT